jgi:hypothetical protein
VPDDNFPHPVSEPEATGLPGTADDDTNAWDDVDSPRVADGPDPGLLPGDRDDGPLAVDRYGTTPEEARVGESVEQKLRREVPDTTAPEGLPGEPLDETTDIVDEETALDEQDPVDPHLDSPVSMYDTGIGGAVARVGRLVEPDEGITADEEKDAVARDAGAAGGGPSAEELAIHPLPED